MSPARVAEALAERAYSDGDFRADLRDRPEDAVRRFDLVTERPVRQGALRRQIPTSWQLRLEPGRARRIL